MLERYLYEVRWIEEGVMDFLCVASYKLLSLDNEKIV